MIKIIKNDEEIYEELENIIDTLISLRNETEDTYYKGRIEDIIEEAKTDQEEVEERLNKVADEELAELNREYERSV